MKHRISEVGARMLKYQEQHVKVYDQKRPVEYADYMPGMLYVSVYEVFPTKTTK